MYELTILPKAKAGIREAAQWYNTRSPGLGKRFTQSVRERSASIRRNPGMFPIRYDEVRTAVLGTFPFMIHFYMDEAEKTVLMTGVFHTSLDPKRWKERRSK